MSINKSSIFTCWLYDYKIFFIIVYKENIILKLKYKYFKNQKIYKSNQLMFTKIF